MKKFLILLFVYLFVGISTANALAIPGVKYINHSEKKCGNAILISGAHDTFRMDGWEKAGIIPNGDFNNFCNSLGYTFVNDVPSPPYVSPIIFVIPLLLFGIFIIIGEFIKKKNKKVDVNKQEIKSFRNTFIFLGIANLLSIKKLFYAIDVSLISTVIWLLFILLGIILLLIGIVSFFSVRENILKSSRFILIFNVLLIFLISFDYFFHGTLRGFIIFLLLTYLIINLVSINNVIKFNQKTV